MIRVPESLDAERAHRFADAILECSDPVVVLAGGPETFCRGMDLTAFATDQAGLETGVGAFARAVHAIRTVAKPVIAVVVGTALGGGVGIAAAADLVIAAPSARFGLPEALFGLVPGVVLPVLLDRMTRQKARWLALTCHTRTALEAQELGLVDQLVADDQLESAVRNAVKVLSRARSSSVASLKQKFDEAALAHGAQETTRLLRIPDVASAVRAFLDGEWVL
jgi:enoyl-CoA hydratase/carnithine racemase